MRPSLDRMTANVSLVRIVPLNRGTVKNAKRRIARRLLS